MTLSSAPSRTSHHRHKQLVPDTRIPMPAGTELIGYCLDKVLGTGSFSIVYDAHEIETGLRVAVKEYYPKRFAQRSENGLVLPLAGKKGLNFLEGIKLFYQEARALEKINHPNVLNMHSLFRANRTAYLVSENHGGRDLKWFLSSLKKPLDQALIYKVFMPILSALNCLHTANLLHLDIKPANILLQPNGHSLLLDFGAAQAMDRNREVSKTQVVTHGFAPPEQYGKHQVLGPWSDVFAISATLYFSIVGRMPGVSKQSGFKPVLDIERLSKSYPLPMLHAINQGLSYDAATRFDSIDSFADALLEGSEWPSLVEYESKEMLFDRCDTAAGCRQHSSALIAA